MAIIDNKVYKLNIYDSKVSNNLYKCADDEKHCKTMLKKLVFYDRNQVVDMHTQSLSQKDEVYDISTLSPVCVLAENEVFDRVVPLDRHWLGVFLKDTKTGEVKDDKVMYISSDGDGYVSDELQPAIEGCVAKSVYLRHLEEDPTSYVRLHDKYFDGTHDEFLSEFFGKVRRIITKLLVSIIKDESTNLKNEELKIREDITLEDIRDALSVEFSKKVKSEDFGTYKLIDMLYAFFHCDKIIALSNKYSETEGLGQNNQSEK